MRMMMALPFFRALNPISRSSGVQFMWESNTEYMPMEETQDILVSEIVHKKLHDRNQVLDQPEFFSDLGSIYHILVGKHYFYSTEWLVFANDECYKGLLDYLIFPLIARKLIADALLEERENNLFINVLAWMIAIPLEIVRCSAAFSLTVLLTPFVAIARFVEAHHLAKTIVIKTPENTIYNHLTHTELTALKQYIVLSVKCSLGDEIAEVVKKKLVVSGYNDGFSNLGFLRFSNLSSEELELPNQVISACKMLAENCFVDHKHNGRPTIRQELLIFNLATPVTDVDDSYTINVSCVDKNKTIEILQTLYPEAESNNQRNACNGAPLNLLMSR